MYYTTREASRKLEVVLEALPSFVCKALARFRRWGQAARDTGQADRVMPYRRVDLDSDGASVDYATHRVLCQVVIACIMLGYEINTNPVGR